MKLFGKFFKPYTEYRLNTSFSEDELKEVFEKEFPSIHSAAAFKSGFEDHDVVFFKQNNPLKLYPGNIGRNSLRGEISIQCEKNENSPDTALHITIVPPNICLFVWSMLCFSIGVGILMLCAGVWQAILPAVDFIGLKKAIRK